MNALYKNLLILFFVGLPVMLGFLRGAKEFDLLGTELIENTGTSILWGAMCLYVLLFVWSLYLMVKNYTAGIFRQYFYCFIALILAGLLIVWFIISALSSIPN